MMNYLNYGKLTENSHDYTIHFHTLVTSSSWNEIALLSALPSRVKQQMAIFEDSVGLESFLLKAQHVSQHLCAVSTEERAPSDTSPSSSSPAPEAMQTDQNHLSATERQRRIQQKLCLYCGEEGHLLHTCPVRPSRSTVNPIHINAVVNNPRFHDAMLIYTNRSFPAIILFDSGSSGNQRSPTCYQITNNSGKTTRQWTGVV